jgi:hypothetical protein
MSIQEDGIISLHPTHHMRMKSDVDAVPHGGFALLICNINYLLALCSLSTLRGSSHDAGRE